MDIDQAFSRFVVAPDWSDPEAVATGLRPFSDVEGAQGDWIRYCLGLALLLIDDAPAFDAISERVCFSESTRGADFRVARIEMLRRRIRYLRENGRDIDREATALLLLAPPSDALRVLRGTPHFERVVSDLVFEDDSLWSPPEEPAPEWAPVALNQPHPSVLVAKPFVPTVRAVNDVEYYHEGGDDVAFRGALVYRALVTSEARIAARAAALAAGEAPVRLAGTAVVLSDSFDGHNYCHWTLDWFTRLLLAEAAGEKVAHVMIRGAHGAGQRETLRQYCEPRGIRVIDTDQRCWFAVDRLIIVDNDRIAETHAAWRGNPFALNLLRKQLDARKPLSDAHRRLYISRRDAAVRHVVNEAELVAMLGRYGFEAVTLSGKSPKEQVEMFGEAAWCIAPHGAGLTNIAFMPEGSHVVELFHGRCGTSGYVGVARGLRQNYAYLVCGQSPADTASITDPFTTRSARHHSTAIWIDVPMFEGWLRSELHRG